MRWRIRPGETPVWIEVHAPADSLSRWRKDAVETGLPVDGLMAARLELHLSMAAFNTGVDRFREASDRMAHEPRRLPPTHLRPWLAALSTGISDRQDELPEVVLPARLAGQASRDWWRHAEAVDPGLARAWEWHSASYGATIQELAWEMVGHAGHALLGARHSPLPRCGRTNTSSYTGFVDGAAAPRCR
jgi:hypothetical protein